MKSDQDHTPKYWVLHNKQTDDVYIQTASKSYSDCSAMSAKLFFNSYWESSDMEIILIEVRMVSV